MGKILKSMTQTESLYNLLSDGRPHRTDEIQVKVYGRDHLGVARISARKYDIEKKYGVTIESWPDPNNRTLTYYRLINRSINRLVKNPMATVELSRPADPLPQPNNSTQDGVFYCCVPVKLTKSFGYQTAQCPRCKKYLIKKDCNLFGDE